MAGRGGLSEEDLMLRAFLYFWYFWKSCEFNYSKIFLLELDLYYLCRQGKVAKIYNK